MKTYGIETEQDYPYTAKNGNCSRDETKIAAYVEEFYKVPPLSSDQLKAALAIGPASVSVDASGVFREYAGGVLNQGCGTSLNHAILAVGYGSTESGEEYYIVRNSWGSSWGENGYIRIGIQEGQGVCGIQVRPSYPLAKKP
jgi:KDEL-tailed cysteine endopeptidase